ncbi:MAG: TonB-dependent receptor [Idiomarina sp.]|nr:TonB-dependent receptor [Idiomarina sp.]
MFASNSLNRSIRLALAFGGASALAFAGAVSAQQQQSNNEEEESEARTEQRVERVQVVGSRIRTDGLDSAAPIDIISTELATEQGLNTLGELLRTSTIASGSDQLISAYSVGFVTAGGSGAESISMRGLGANRTLVLLNGRRAGPAGTRGQVAAFDMNALPVSAVERVEILKDGASSLYGSDAVAGVINIITKRGDESSINVSASQPFDSGGETFRVNGTWGTTFDRGSFRVVADYNHNTGLKRGDRSHFACNSRYWFDFETGERADPIDPRTGEPHCNAAGFGLFSGQGGRFQFDYDGFGFPPIEGDHPLVDTAPAGWFWSGRDYETDGWFDGSSDRHRAQSMIPESRVMSVYTQGDYDLTNTISLYGEFMHSQRTTNADSVRQIFPSHPGLPAQIPINNIPGWEGSATVQYVALTNHFSSETVVDYTRGVIGLEGSLGFWNWDASFQRSLNRGTYEQDIYLADSFRMYHLWALGAGDCAGETSPISGRACVEEPWWSPDFLRGDFSQGFRDFVQASDKGKTIYKQDTFDAYITGDLFDLPAGTVATAVGVSYQTDELQDTPGINSRTGNSWGLTSAGITAGRATTRAVYGEVVIPVLRDLPFAESFDLTASARYTEVSAYGSGSTYKASINWNVGGGFRVRASQGTSFRAPALFELYLQQQTGFLGQNSDPCVNWVESNNPLIQQNCQAAGVPESYIAPVGGSITSITGGGVGQLDAETSVSKGIGLVYTSPMNRFAGSIDYYDVIIEGQISNIGGATVLNQCYTTEVGIENEPFCRQITRRTGIDDDWGVQEVRGGYLNVAEQGIRGVDLVATYTEETPVGLLRVRLNHTATIERYNKTFADSDKFVFTGRIGSPKHSGNLNTSLQRDNWRFNWNIQYVSAVSNYDGFLNGNRITSRPNDGGGTFRFVAHAPTYFMHSLSANTTVFDNIDLTFGVSNLFDRIPPQGSPAAVNTAGNTLLFASQYDLLGRRAFLNATYSF